MKFVSRYGIPICLIVLSLIIYPYPCISVNLPWSTTFNCPDWDGTGKWPNCDNLLENSGNQVRYPSLINSSGNNSAGGGGKGFRYAVGDGSNNTGDKPWIQHTAVNEVWYRMYLRFPRGFTWKPLVYFKLFYPIPGKVILGMGGNGISFQAPAGFKDHWTNSPRNFGWTSIMRGSTGDGKWHCFELHMNNSGIVDLWIDGVLRMHHTGVDYGGMTFSQMRFLCNQAAPNNGRTVYVDLDDIAISATGYIGPIVTPRTGLKNE